MANNKQVCDLAPGKGMTRAQSNEHLRNFSATAYERKRSGNFDPTREKLNFEVKKGGVITPVDKSNSITKRIKENLKARGIKDPNLGKEKPDIRTVANFILGGSREQMHKLAFGDQKVDLNHGADNSQITRCEDVEKWAIDTYKFLAQKYGEDNLVAFVIHLDETNPHVHATVLPITQKNKFSWKQVMVGEDKYEYRQRMMQLHDEFAEVNKKYGLERGDAVAVTGAKHRTTEQYRDWLDEQSKKLEEKIDNQKKIIYEQNDQIKQAEKRLKALTTMLSNLEAQRQQIEQEINTLETQTDEDRMTHDEVDRRNEVLRKELDSILSKIKERQEQLQKAKQQLQDVANRKSELVEEMKTVEKQLKEDQSALNRKSLNDMQSTAWEMAAEDATERISKLDDYARTLPPEDRKILDNMYANVFDGSIFEEMAQKADEIAVVATALFLNNIGGAVEFAQSHGGGGGKPGSGWGRKKDDDDDSWRRKCFLMGMHMMKSPGRKLKR